MSPRRADLLELVAAYDRRPSRRIGRIERWRRRELSAGSVVRRSDELAAELAGAGLGPDDRIGLHLNDGPLWQVAFLAVLRIGGIAVPIDVSLDGDLVRRQAGELELDAWIDESEAPRVEAPAARFTLDWRSDAGGRGRSAASPGRAADGCSGSPPPLPDDDPERIAEIVLTSGTSGAPTAVPIRHRNLRSVVDALLGEIEPYRPALRLAPPLHLAVVLPLSHLYGQMMGLFVPVLLDADVSSMPPLPAHELARGLRENGAWVLATVPRTLDRLAEHLRAVGEDRWGADGMRRRLEEAEGRHWLRRWKAFAPLRRRLGHRLVAVISGGAPLDPGTEDLFRTLGYVVVQGYGLTETAPLVTLEHPFDSRPRSLGRPLPGIEVRLAADGEILVRGDNVASARLGGPAVDDEGWLHTGDLGAFDDDGRLRFRGRKGERIVTPAGVNVDPEPVAARLRRRPGIRDAVVTERPWGERGAVCAVLLPEPGGDPESAVARVNEELPDAARIRTWRIWPDADFPRTHTEKPRRAEIDGWLRRQAPAGESDPTEEEAVGRGDGDGAGPPPDAYGAVARAVAEVSEVGPDDLDPGTRIGDVTTSLDRVELAALLERDFGVALPGRAFGGDPTLGEIADALGPDRRPGGAGAAEAVEGVGARDGVAPGGREEGESSEVEPRYPAARRPWLPGEETGVAAARWRSSVPVRAIRLLLREGIMHPLWTLLFELRVEGREHARALEPPFLVAANHQSVLDPGAVLFGLDRRRRAGIAPAARWDHFVEASTGRLQYALGVMGLDLIPLLQSGDWRPTLRIAGGVADRGGCPLVFPEGVRSVTGELRDFRLGIGVMARELRLPILPCAIRGLLEVLPRGSRWPANCWQRRAPVTIRFGEAIPAPHPDDDPAVVVAELRARVGELLLS